jgi:hypothetical protein
MAHAHRPPAPACYCCSGLGRRPAELTYTAYSVTRRNLAGSSGGKANEAGSLHRSGVAAYLAAHGLVGRGVEAAGDSEDGPAPVALSFETGEAVDDVRCDLSDGGVLLIQAKRSCGDDRHLAATAAQWAGYEPDLQAGQRLALATADPRGPVRMLGRALDRRRRAIPGPMSSAEQDALAAVRGRFPDGMAQHTVERVLDSAVVMTIAAESALDSEFRQAASLLDGALVPVGSGSKAISALQQAFRVQAAVGTGSGIDEWLEILALAGLEVFADADGPAGLRRRAEMTAVLAHRKRLADRDGVLQYSLLAEDLPPMRYPSLADSLQVSVARPKARTDQLLHLARRWPRLLLTGLPGTGKSTALEQLAARWAADLEAPVPILVQLRELLPRDPRRRTDVSLGNLIEIATTEAAQDEQIPLRRALERAVLSGDAVLLLDGLDECRERRAVVADSLAALADELPPITGLVLATRGSGLSAARKLGLPEAELAEPYWPGSVLGKLLEHAALHRLPLAERDSWVQAHKQWLDQARLDQPDVWRIPLLATLLTLLAASRNAESLPTSRAKLLAEAVHETIDQWEMSRMATAETPFRPRLRAKQLLDGYVAIAHTLASIGTASAEDVLETVVTMLGARWGMAVGEAEAAAADVIWFWDEHLGVFVSSPVDGHVNSRSRVFTEIGDAMWAAARDRTTQQAWVAAALADEDLRDVVLLAAGLSDDITDSLVQAAGDQHYPAEVRSRALLWAADAVIEGAAVSARPLEALLSSLAGAAREAFQSPPAMKDDQNEGSLFGPKGSERAGPGWTYARRIAMLPLPVGLRAVREDLLAGLTGTEEQVAVAGGICALADARADRLSSLTSAQVVAVTRLLESPIPDRGPLTSRQITRGHVVVTGGSSGAIPGHCRAAEEAIEYLSQLGPGASDLVYRIAHCGSWGGYNRISARLEAIGFHDPERDDSHRTSVALLNRVAEVWEDWDVFLAAATSIATPRQPTRTECWRLPDLAALTDLLDPLNATLVGMDVAFGSERSLLSGWINAIAVGADLDLPGISGQAGAALKTLEAGDETVVDVIVAPPPASPALCHASRLGQDDIGALIDSLGAASDWLATVACTVLEPAHDPRIAQMLLARLPQMRPNRRRIAAIVLLANDSNILGRAALLLSADDPPIRAGAAAVAATLGRCDAAGPWAKLLVGALGDDDMTVRLEAGQEHSAATAGAAYWSCVDCGSRNEMTSADCAFCQSGTRPSHR